MEWSLKRIRAYVCTIIVVASVIGVGLELVPYNQNSKPELSNNITIIVEVAVGFVIAVIVYGLTKIEKKKTDNEIENIRDITDRLEAVSYEIEKEQIVRNHENLQLLLLYNNRMSSVYNEIQNKPTRNCENMKNSLSTLSALYRVHAKVVEHTPVLHSEMNIIGSSTPIIYDNLKNCGKNENWNKLLADLEYMIGLKQIIKEHAKKEQEKLDKLKSKYEGIATRQSSFQENYTKPKTL